MNKLSSQLLLDIISHELQVPATRMWLRNQNVLIPPDDQLYFIAGIFGAPVIISNVTSLVDVVNPYDWDAPGSVWDAANARWDRIDLTQRNEVIQLENVLIDIVSRNNDALMRYWEVTAAMQSFYAQQVMERNNFKIFRPASIVDTSAAEGGSNLNRYSITIPCHVWYRKETIMVPPGDYYDDFKQRVDDAHTIGTQTGLIEFEITPDTKPPL